MIRCGLICSSWWLKKNDGWELLGGQGKVLFKIIFSGYSQLPQPLFFSLFLFSLHLFFLSFLLFSSLSLSVHILFISSLLIWLPFLSFALLFFLYFLIYFSFLPIFLYIFHPFLSSLLIWLPFLLTVFFCPSFSLCFSLSFSLSDSFLTLLTSQHQYVYQFASRRHQESRLILTIIKESQ